MFMDFLKCFYGIDHGHDSFIVFLTIFCFHLMFLDFHKKVEKVNHLSIEI